MERFIAVDNVCAWPNLTKMPDGAVVATIFNQPTHGGWEGDVECRASRDEGRTWTLRGVPAPHEAETNRMNVAAGLARDGALIVLVSGWDKRPPVGKWENFDDAKTLPNWVCRSADGGQTWERSESVAPPEGGSERIIPFGDIVQLTDGALGACIYGAQSMDKHTSYFYASSDDGRSWSLRGTICQDNGNETAPVVLPDGRLLAAVRTVDDQHLELFESQDQGKTWTNHGPLTLGAQHPAHFLILNDGRILLTYGIRNKGLYGIGARLSDDQGRTWTPPRVLVNLEDTQDGGYPASVQTQDETVITAYYAKGIPAHRRYHMGVIRWRPDEE